MALPINATPVYTLTIPSTKQEVKYRPFLVKEEKALLIAQQSEDEQVMLDTLKNIIGSCIKSDVNVDKFATFDLEYIFTQIRARSVGETVDLTFTCDICQTAEAKATISLDLTELQVQIDPTHSQRIALFDDVGIMFKYPDISLVNKLSKMKTGEVEQMFEVIINCVDYIFTAEEIFYAKDQTKAELNEFLDNLTSEQFAKVQNFFETMPKLRHDIEYTCPVCSKVHKKYIEGIQNFF